MDDIGISYMSDLVNDELPGFEVLPLSFCFEQAESWNLVALDNGFVNSHAKLHFVLTARTAFIILFIYIDVNEDVFALDPDGHLVVGSHQLGQFLLCLLAPRAPL